MILMSVLKYGIVGGVTGLIYFLLMWASNEILSLRYILAVSLAYFFSTVFHYLANRYFTFSAKTDSNLTQLMRYATVWIFNYIITVLIVSIFVEYFRQSPYLGVCASVLLTSVFGYVLSKYWVFKTRGGGYE